MSEELVSASNKGGQSADPTVSIRATILDQNEVLSLAKSSLMSTDSTTPSLPIRPQREGPLRKLDAFSWSDFLDSHELESNGAASTTSSPKTISTHNDAESSDETAPGEHNAANSGSVSNETSMQRGEMCDPVSAQRKEVATDIDTLMAPDAESQHHPSPSLQADFKTTPSGEEIYGLPCHDDSDGLTIGEVDRFDSIYSISTVGLSSMKLSQPFGDSSSSDSDSECSVDHAFQAMDADPLNTEPEQELDSEEDETSMMSITEQQSPVTGTAPQAAEDLFCNQCSKTIDPSQDFFFRCNVCASGPWDLCEQCVEESVQCPGGHELLKCAINDDKVMAFEESVYLPGSYGDDNDDDGCSTSDEEETTSCGIKESKGTKRRMFFADEEEDDAEDTPRKKRVKFTKDTKSSSQEDDDASDNDNENENDNSRIPKSPASQINDLTTLLDRSTAANDGLVRIAQQAREELQCATYDLDRFRNALRATAAECRVLNNRARGFRAFLDLLRAMKPDERAAWLLDDQFRAGGKSGLVFGAEEDSELKDLKSAVGEIARACVPVSECCMRCRGADFAEGSTGSSERDALMPPSPPFVTPPACSQDDEMDDGVRDG